jgi:hypothetical protein
MKMEAKYPYESFLSVRLHVLTAGANLREPCLVLSPSASIGNTYSSGRDAKWFGAYFKNGCSHQVNMGESIERFLYGSIRLLSLL